MARDEIDRHAQVIWDYLQLHQELVKSDAIFCLCSHDPRVAVRAAELIKEDYGKYLIISGGSGKLTKDIFDEPEAKVFEKIALEMGVSPDQIIIEDKSSNTGENVRFTYNLLKRMRLKLTSFVLVQKPYMERRTYATFKKQWPDDKTSITVTSPQMSFEEYVAGGIPKNEVINIMVGDLQRIREYPKIGFQIEQNIPPKIWASYEALVSTGFTEHLIHQKN